MTDLLTERLHAGAERIAAPLRPASEIRHGAERGRRMRRAAASTLVGAVVVAAVVLGSGPGGAQRTEPLPATSPRPTPGIYALASDPFLTVSDWDYVRSDIAPGRLTECITSPLTWTAAESHGARFVDPQHPGTVFNEFVLRFDTVAGAHQAVADAWDQFAGCPTPPEVLTDPLLRPSASAGELEDEGFANQRAEFATAAHKGQPVSMYALRVSRIGDVVVVVEDLGEPDDRSQVIMIPALQNAVRDG
jgi:hypothetical protein